MWKNYAFATAFLFAVALIPIVQQADALPFISKEKGLDYDLELISINADGSRTYQKTTVPPRLYYDGMYQDYRLTESAGSVKLETGHAGSLVFDKTACTYDLYISGFIDELSVPELNNVSWTVKGKAASSSTWSSVNTVNNAACNVSVSTTESTVKIIGERSSASGTFQIVLDYIPGNGIKETFRAYNNNPAWNNHNIGFTETLEVPRIINFGNKTYDLANHNGTVLNRNWIENNNAKLVKFSDNSFYDFGIGFDNLNDVKITWDGSKAKLAFNYLYPTTIVPYQTWFEVDPTLNFNVGGTNNVGALYDVQERMGQRIADTAPRGAVLDSVTMRFKKTGSPTGSMVGEMRTVSGDTLVATSTNSKDVSTITTGAGGEDVTFTFSQPTIPSAEFRIVAYYAGGDGTNYIDVLGSTTDTVANQQFTYTFPDNTWNDVATSDVRGSMTYTFSPPNPPTNFNCTPVDNYVSCTWTASSPGTGVAGYFIGRSLDNSTFPAANKTSVGNVTSYSLTQYLRPGLLYYVNITASKTGVGNSTSAYDSFTANNRPDAPTLRQPMVAISGTAINATSTAGASNGGDAVKDFGLRCELNNTGGWQTVVSNSTIPSNRKYTISGLWSTGDVLICQWRDGNSIGWSAWSNNSTYPPRPDAVTDLEVVAVFQTTAQIQWTAPNIYGLTLIGYQVNYTSPWGTPTTVITTTNSSDTEYLISGLTPNTQYSFRVSAVTDTGKNASGNIVNVATITAFSVGDIDLDDANPLRMPIRFVQTDLNSTTTELEVIYDNEFELDCEMYFQFAQDTQEYDNLNGTEYDDDNDSVIFYFNNASNEVITVDCLDSITNATGRYQFQQSNFPLLDLINGFRDGTYGTAGQFGVIDLITLMAIIFGMIGFNRVNPSVGAVLMFFIMGGLAYFEIIQWYTLASGMVAMLIFVVVAATRKDD